MIRSKPTKGLDLGAWDRKDIDLWFSFIRRQSKGEPPLTAKERTEVERIRKKYSLDKYYLFT